MLLADGTPVPFAPQALAETTPLLNDGYWYAQDGLWLDRLHATYGMIYRTQPWVAAVVDKIAALTARLSLRVWDLSSPSGKVLDTDSPYARLIARPNPTLPPFAFKRWIAATSEIYGETYVYKARDPATGDVFALYPMHPTRTAVKRDEDGNEWFLFTVGVASAGLLKAPAADVIPFRRYNPDNVMRGLSRLEPLRSTLLNEDAARRATASWWRNGARPSVILSHPKQLSDKVQERIARSWQAMHGGADNMARSAVLEEGMTATVVQLSAEEMQYIESRKLNREEVCGVYDFPPPALHILDHATFSNITEQNRMIYRDTMPPRLEDIESVLDYHLRTEFFTADDQRYASFSLDDVLRGDFETRATAVQQLVTSGVMMPAEARLLFDLPDAGEIARRLYANAALVPLGSAPKQQPVATDGSLMPRALPAGSHGDDQADNTERDQTGDNQANQRELRVRRHVRALMGRIGRVKAAGDPVELRQRLAAEHAAELAAYFGRQYAALADATDDDAVDELADEDWNSALGDILLATSSVIAKSIGDLVSESLGGTYDPAAVGHWLADNAAASAGHINKATVSDLLHNLAGSSGAARADTISNYFGTTAKNRAAEIAATRVAVVGGLAEQSAARQAGAATKTWRVNSANPRASHAAMDGETVPLGEPFSNGMNGPGDPAGGADEVAGCTCSLDFATDTGAGKALKYSADQPRDEHGRFAGGGSSGGGSGRGHGARMSAKRARDVIAATREAGGTSVQVGTGNTPTSGYMVSEKDGGHVMDAEQFYGPQGAGILQSYVSAHGDSLGAPDAYLGTWHDQASGKVFLDVSHNVADRGAAINLGKANDQIAIWDVARMEEVPTGGTGGLGKAAPPADRAAPPAAEAPCPVCGLTRTNTSATLEHFRSQAARKAATE